jgi:signal peptidase II
MNATEKKKLLLIGWTSAGIVILDQILKFLVIKNMALLQSIPIIPNFLHLTYIQNTGSAFGLCPDSAKLLIWLSIIVIGVIMFLYDRIPEDRCSQLSVSAILAGVFGNLIDRINLGYVIDFIDFRIWPAFNIADAAITIGVIFLIIQIIKKDIKEKKKKR